ncbi:MAG: hypothetical protein AABW58_02490 [Nanoarchaeota archaeon]
MSKKEIRSTGIIHFWEFPSLYVKINKNFKEQLMNNFFKEKTTNQAAELLHISVTTIRNLKKNSYRLKIDYLIKISKHISKKEFSLEEIQKNIVWIGDKSSYGVVNPNLPFDFNSREGARFLAAICNDGWISDGVYYSNSDSYLRKSVKSDGLSIFGGDKNTIKIWIKKKDQYLSFPSIIRDSMISMTDFKGVKSINNPNIPDIIFKSKDFMCGWVEQTIADEGCIKFYLEKYRREIIWTRSFKKELPRYNLHLNELQILNRLGIKCKTYDVGEYYDKDGVLKTRKAIRIAKRKNLIKLRDLIKIPCKRKEKDFSDMMKSFQRYKEPLIIKEKIINLCNIYGYLTASTLKKEMNYKRVSNASKWIKLFEGEGLIKRVKDYSCGSLAKYVLIHK